MKLIAESEDQLVFFSRPWSRWIAALLLAALGVGILWELRPGFDRNSVMLDLLAGSSILGGLGIAALLPRVTAVFDLRTGALLLHRQTLLGKSRERIPLAAIAEVEAHRYHLRHSSGYRVLLRLANGRTLPIGSDMYSLPARAEQEAEKIRALLDRHARTAHRERIRTSVSSP